MGSRSTIQAAGIKHHQAQQKGDRFGRPFVARQASYSVIVNVYFEAPEADLIYKL